MSKPVFINSVGSVSAQKTFDNSQFLEDIVTYEATTLQVLDPNYKDFIPPAQARRMAKGIKMSTASAKKAMADARVEEAQIDAIIVGTGLGCIGDSEKFVRDIIDNEEQYLTPTRFIQSSHNTVGGQIALGMGCKGHNFTFVHSAISFESALLDAKMQLEEDEARHILVGGVDELVDHHVETHRLVKHIKEQPIPTDSLLTSGTNGTIFSEGAHFFVVSNERQESCHAQLMGMRMYNTVAKDRIGTNIQNFLNDNGLPIDQIDLVILGYNGDAEFDGYYDALADELFPETAQAHYKHLSGEFDTASAFGFWLGNKILRLQTIPEAVRRNQIQVHTIQNVLLYNQYRGENHSVIWLRRC